MFEGGRSAASRTPKRQETSGPRSAPQKGGASPEPPGQRVKASAAKSNPSTLRPASKMSTAPGTTGTQPASTQRCYSAQISVQRAGRNPSVKASNVPGRPLLQDAKKMELPRWHQTPDECARKSFPPPITPDKTSTHRSEIPQNVSRKYTRCAQEKDDYAVPVANMEYVSKQKGQKSRGRKSQGAEQVPVGFSLCNPHKSSVAPPRPYPEVAVETKKCIAKQHGTVTLPSRSRTTAAKKADFVVVTESDSCGGGPPKSFIPCRLRETRGDALRAAVSPPKPAKYATPRTVSFAPTPAGPAKKSQSTYLLRDVERPVLQPCSGSRSCKRTSMAGMRDKPHDLRVPRSVHRGAKFDPFKPPSKLEELVGTTCASYATPSIASPPRNKLPVKRLSSFPGLPNSETDATPQKPAALNFSKRDEIVAMQKLAGVCLFLCIIATTLFVGYYVSWSIQDSEPTTYNPPLTSDGKSENNRSLPFFPLVVANENWIQSETRK